jgi:hypothetical protein
VLACSTVVIFNSAVLIFPISIGRALLFAIIRLPLACGLKSNGNDYSEIVLGLLGFLGEQSNFFVLLLNIFC